MADGFLRKYHPSVHPQIDANTDLSYLVHGVPWMQKLHGVSDSSTEMPFSQGSIDLIHRVHNGLMDLDPR